MAGGASCNQTFVLSKISTLGRWSIELVLISYELAKRLPLTERFELSAQIRRAAVSVPSNVAEGQAAEKSLRFLYHVRIALGSLGELETDFEIARRLGMLSSDDLAELNAHVARSGQLLHGLARSFDSNYEHRQRAV